MAASGQTVWVVCGLWALTGFRLCTPRWIAEPVLVSGCTGAAPSAPAGKRR